MSPEKADECLQVKCGTKIAEFFPLTYKKVGRGIAKCIKHKGQWLNPTEFENLAGIQGKKWRQSIKFEGKPLAEWLARSEKSPGLENIPPSTQQPWNAEVIQGTQGQQVDNCTQHATSIVDKSGDPCSIQDAVADSSALHDRADRITLHGKPDETDVCTQHTVDDGGKDLQQAQQAQQTIQTPTALSRKIPTPDLQDFFMVLERQLTESLGELIREAIKPFKERFDRELLSMKRSIGELSNRIAELEKMTPSQPHTCKPTASPTESRKSFSEVVSGITPSSIEDQVAQLSDTISSQQRLIEINEREKRERNMIVVGLKESEGSTNSLINSLLENKLDLQDTGVSSCRRLGTPNKSSSKPRPVLVVFDTVEKKRTAMKNRAALAGTEIFLNNDLTKDKCSKRSN